MCFLSFLPILERYSCEARVVVAFVAGYLFPEERRAFELLICASELYFGYGKPFVVAVELIDLEGVCPAFNKVTSLVDDASMA